MNNILDVLFVTIILFLSAYIFLRSVLLVKEIIYQLKTRECTPKTKTRVAWILDILVIATMIVIVTGWIN